MCQNVVAMDQGIRVTSAELRSLRLRAHELLRDAPLHDAWRMQLTGGGTNRTVGEALELLADLEGLRPGAAARILFGLRKALGGIFGWDRELASASSRSYLHRLTPGDRNRSSDEPGTRRGFWTSIYTFEREALAEVINRTVHALMLFVLQPAPGGYTLYMAVYVKPVSRFTAIYMALIDPFRRSLIYPAFVRRVERAWCQKWRDHHTRGEARSTL